MESLQHQHEEIALALIREFLSSHGLKSVVQELDSQRPRTDTSITRRSDIVKKLSIQEWFKQNKTSNLPLRSILEVIAKNLATEETSSNQKANKSQEKKAETPFATVSVTDSLGIGKLTVGRPSKSRADSQTSVLRTRLVADSESCNKGGNGLNMDNTYSESKSSRHSSSNSDAALSYLLDCSKVASLDTRYSKPGRSKHVNGASHINSRDTNVDTEMIMEDVDDTSTPMECNRYGSLPQPKPQVLHQQNLIKDDSSGRSITKVEAIKLKQVLLGSARSSFSSAWLQQNFCFNKIKGLEYGLLQHEGGPCGVLAAVQAVFLKHLLFSTESVIKTLDSNKLRPEISSAEEVLVTAIADILLRIQRDGDIFVATLGNLSTKQFSSEFKRDGITEKLIVTTCTSEFALRRHITANLHQFTATDAPGVILLVYSAILTRGVDNIKTDMDEESITLIGRHSYCTQELVSLLIVGHACSNTHDNDRHLGDGKDQIVLKGTRKRSDIGLLSLFEHYGSCEASVGLNLKQPTVPIWIIYAESHFTVLFSTNSTLSYIKPNSKFQLHYYDQLAGLEYPYTINIDPLANIPRPPDDLLLPPLEHCIRTKLVNAVSQTDHFPFIPRWPGADIDWGACEPLY
eukprot:gene9128-1426_t